jgi:hypothetical protein
VLTLTTIGAATASATDYAQALASVEFREAAGDDPTHGGAGSETARTVTWTVTDTNTNTASNTTSFTSTLDTIHKPPVVTAGATITYPELEQRHEHARHGSYAEPDGRRDGDLHAKSNVGGPAR